MNRHRSLLLAVLLVGVAVTSVVAQSARAAGVIRDQGGRPIKGATVRAINPDASPSEFTSTSDDKGRWAMIGLRTGIWRFIVEAPGYFKVEASAPMRVAGTPPIVVTLGRDPGPVPNALDPNIQKHLAAANALRDEGRFDQAIAAYQEIRAKNPTLTSVGVVIGNAYRGRAAKETDPAARRALLDRAIESYMDVLKADAGNEGAKRELELVREEASSPATR